MLAIYARITYDEVATEVQCSGDLPYPLRVGLLLGIVHLQPGLLAVLLNVHCVPLVVIQGIGRFVFQHLHSIANIVTELDCISICTQKTLSFHTYFVINFTSYEVDTMHTKFYFNKLYRNVEFF